MKQKQEITMKQFHTDVIQVMDAGENGIRVVICEDESASLLSLPTV